MENKNPLQIHSFDFCNCQIPNQKKEEYNSEGKFFRDYIKESYEKSVMIILVASMAFGMAGAGGGAERPKAHRLQSLPHPIRRERQFWNNYPADEMWHHLVYGFPWSSQNFEEAIYKRTGVR